MSNNSIVSQCCVKLSDGWSAECSTVQWSDCVLSNCPMVKECCFKLSNAWRVLCLIVQWSDSAVSFCPTVQWLDSAVSSSPSIVLQYNFNLCSSKMVWKGKYYALNCLGGCKNTFFYVLLTLAKCCEVLCILSESLGFKILLYLTFSNFLHPCLHVSLKGSNLIFT